MRYRHPARSGVVTTGRGVLLWRCLDSRSGESGAALFNLTERPLRQPHRTSDVGEADDLRVEVKSPPVRLRGPCEVFVLLRQASEGSSCPRQRVGPGTIAVRKLRGLPVAG